MDLMFDRGGAMGFMDSAIERQLQQVSKSARHSATGHMSRIVKRSSDRISITKTGLLGSITMPSIISTSLCVVTEYPEEEDASTNGDYGVPSLRAISKCTSRSMANSLKIKSGATVPPTSPTLDMLQGSEKTIIFIGSRSCATLV